MRYLVAGCSERCAQIFTGTRGDDSSRAEDCLTLLAALDHLWDLDVTREVLAADVSSLDAFEELRVHGEDEEEVVDAADIYAFFAVATTRFACAYAATGVIDHAIQCAHLALTAMGQLDANAGSAYMQDEFDRQDQAVSSAVSLGHRGMRSTRAVDQEAGLARWSAVRDLVGR